jgi:hypothetical protein
MTIAVLALLSRCDVFFSRLRVTAEVCDLIRLDMPRSEVEALIGGPPGDYTDRVWYLSGVPCHYPERKCWYADTGVICVWFEEDRVVQAMYFGPAGYHPTFWERWRWRLGL